MPVISSHSCVMFKGQVERRASSIKQLLVYSDRAVVVAINPECVHLFKEATDSCPRVSVRAHDMQ